MLARWFLLCLLLAPALPEGGATDVVRFGRNIVLAADQPFHNASCFLCSARVDGHASGSVRVFAGNVLLNGSVAGTILVFGGNVTLAGNAVVGERVVVFGGRFHQDSGAPEVAHTIVPPIIFLPLILLICIITAGLIHFTRGRVRVPGGYPPLPRL